MQILEEYDSKVRTSEVMKQDRDEDETEEHK